MYGHPLTLGEVEHTARMVSRRDVVGGKPTPVVVCQSAIDNSRWYLVKLAQLLPREHARFASAFVGDTRYDSLDALRNAL